MKNLADNGGSVQRLSTQQPRTGNAMTVNPIHRHQRLSCHSRVVVTGLGAVTPMAVGVEPSWAAVCRGKSGIRRVTRFDTSHMRTGIAGEVHGFDASNFMDVKIAKRYDRFVVLALAASRMAAEDAELVVHRPNHRRMAVVIGNCLGGASLMEQGFGLVTNGRENRVSPYFIPGIIGSSAPGLVAIALGIQGPSLAVNSACASGADAVGRGLDLIRNGTVDMVIAGGTEAPITPLLYHGLSAMKATSARNSEPAKASRPFDRERDGFVPAEAAAILVLESMESALRRGVRIHAEVAGFGASCDAHHITSPDPQAAGAVAAMTNAIREAGMEAADVDYVNAHGTSTPLNDLVETRAIKKVFGARAAALPVSSCKSVTGHTIAAAGALEAIFSVLSIRDGIVPPTANYEAQDPECDLDYVPNHAREKEVRTVLSNSFGFGGMNTALVMTQWTEKPYD
jgi:3-oxoacyl-[acyl-carrier-protein] synthase II